MVYKKKLNKHHTRFGASEGGDLWLVKLLHGRASFL